MGSWDRGYLFIDSNRIWTFVAKDEMVKEDVDLHGRLEEAEIKTFLRGYGLELEAGGCEKLYGGYSGSNYRADCDDDVSVLVKVSVGENAQEELEHQAMFLDMLRSAGYRFSASPFQPKHASTSSSGASSYSSVLGGGSAIVLTFVPGTAADRAIAEGTSSPLSTIMQAGRALGELHALEISQFGTLRTSTPGGSGTCMGEIEDALATGGELRCDAATGGDGIDFIEFLTERLPTLRSMMQDTELANGLLHGDPFLDNIVVDQRGVVAGFVDWEDAAQGPLIMDLACAAIGCCYDEGDFSSEPCPSRYQALLQGYCSARHLSKHEEERLATAMQCSLLSNAFFRFRQFRVRHPELTACRDSHAELVRRIKAIDGLSAPLLLPMPHQGQLWSRGLFSLEAAGHTYLDGAGRAALPDSVLDAGSQNLLMLSTPWNVPDHGEFTSGLRQAASSLLGVGSPSDIAITPSTAQALSTVAAGLSLKPGEYVVVLEQQSASNVMMWQALVDRCPGSYLKVVPRPSIGGGGRGRRILQTWTDMVVDAISMSDDGQEGKCAAAALPNAHWSDGSMLDLQAIADRCRQVKALLLLDITQTLGAMPFDGASIRPDAAAFSIHKWLHGPHGISMLYVAESLHDIVKPLVHHDRNRAGSTDPRWDEIGAMTDSGYPTEFLPGEPGRKYDGGGRPSPLLLPMMCEGVRLVESFGASRIASYCAPLTERIADCARNLGLWVPSWRAPHFLGIRVPDGGDLAGRGADPTSIRQALKEMGFHVSVRAGAIRVSVYLYSTLDHVDSFCCALEKIVSDLPGVKQ